MINRWHYAIPPCKVNATQWYLIFYNKLLLDVAALFESSGFSTIPALNHQCISHFFQRTACFNKPPTPTNSFWFISTTANGFAAFAGSLYEPIIRHTIGLEQTSLLLVQSQSQHHWASNYKRILEIYGRQPQWQLVLFRMQICVQNITNL